MIEGTEEETLITLDFSGTEKKFTDIDALREFLQYEQSAWFWLEQAVLRDKKLDRVWNPYRKYFTKVNQFIESYMMLPNKYSTLTELINSIKAETKIATDQGCILAETPLARFIFELKDNESPQVAGYALASLSGIKIEANNPDAFTGKHEAMKYLQDIETDSADVQQKKLEARNMLMIRKITALQKRSSLLVKKAEEQVTMQASIFENQVAKQAGDLENQITEQAKIFENQAAKQKSDFENRITRQETAFESQATEQVSAFENQMTEQASVIQNRRTEQANTIKTQITEQASAFENQMTEQASIFEDQTTKQASVFEDQTTEQARIIESQTTEQAKVFENRTAKQESDFELILNGAKKRLTDFENQKTTQENVLERQVDKQAKVFENRTAKQESDFELILNGAKKRLTDFENQKATQENVFERRIDKQASDSEKQIAKQAEDFEITLNEAKGKLTDFETTFKENIALQSSVAYWTKKREHHQKVMWWLAVFTVTSAVVTGLVTIQAANEYLDKTIDEVKLAQIGVTLAISTLGVWLTRLSAKIFISNLHLRTDADERVTMIQTYLAFLAEGKGPKDDERQLILQTLFRPSTTGFIKDDGPTTPFGTIVTKATSKKG